VARWELLNSASTGRCLSGLLPQEMQGSCYLFRTSLANTVCILTGLLALNIAAQPQSPDFSSY
jgi:hypothetical protein